VRGERRKRKIISRRERNCNNFEVLQHTFVEYVPENWPRFAVGLLKRKCFHGK